MKEFIKKTLLLIILIVININCIFVFGLLSSILFVGYVSFSIPYFIHNILIIIWILLLISIFFSFSINFSYFIRYLYKQVEKKNGKK